MGEGEVLGEDELWDGGGPDEIERWWEVGRIGRLGGRGIDPGGRTAPRKAAAGKGKCDDLATAAAAADAAAAWR